MGLPYQLEISKPFAARTQLVISDKLARVYRAGDPRTLEFRVTSELATFLPSSIEAILPCVTDDVVGLAGDHHDAN